MKVIILCSINNIEAIDKEINLFKFKLSSNMSQLDELFSDTGLEKGIGRFALNQFKSGCYFYSQMNLKTLSDENISEEEIKILQDNITAYYGILESFVSYLWFTRDNCCSLNSLYIYLPTAKKLLTRKAMSVFSTSKGQEGESVKFTVEELLKIASMYVSATKLFYHKNLKPKTTEDEMQDELCEREIIPYDFKKETRIERAFHFLLLSRRSNQLALKVSFYICIYETLFYGSSNGEITHQIAERVALYYTNTRMFRSSVYKQIKEAYKVRSRYFHGSSFKGFTKDLKQISYHLDNLTRNILYRIFVKDSTSHLKNT